MALKRLEINLYPFLWQWILAFLIGNGMADALQAQPLPGTWTIKPLTIDANEGCALGDLDGDGSLDIVAGRNWYAAPDFVPKPLRTIEDWNGYVESNGDFLFDVNDDGRLDVIAGSFLPTEVFWFENPGPEGLRLGQCWKKHPLIDTGYSQNESQLLSDLDGDGIPEWLVNSWSPKNPLVAWRFMHTREADQSGARYKLVPAMIAETGNSHGLGIGDLNGDGRSDVLTGAGWYERPAEDPWGHPWKFHNDWDLQASIPMLVADVDKDGRNDVLVGAGHDYGLFWWRQKEPDAEGKLQFDKRLIDDSYSQPHTLALADLDGDGTEELITGKRYFAHNGGDPGGRDAPLICYYTYDPSSASFRKTVIDHERVGTGLQIRTGDLDGDGRTDIVVAGKSGTYLLLNPAGPGQ
jgi:hypothetical protein